MLSKTACSLAPNMRTWVSGHIKQYAVTITTVAALPVSPGGLLRVCCYNPSTAVAITNGAEDTIEVKVHPDSAASQVSVLTLPTDSTVEVTEAPSPSSNSTTAQLIHINSTVSQHTPAGSCSSAGSSQQSPQAAVTLSAAIPSRFCGVHVATAGGNVSVARLQEAQLDITTQGGSVAVQRCGASHALISTTVPKQQGCGGHIKVTELAASQVRLLSGGGNISLRRLAALDAEVLSEGGSIHLGASYGGKAHLVSGSGSLSVGHMACSGLGILESGGGSLTVDGLEGNASLVSAGGDIKVHVHEHFGHVFVDSSGGSVEAWISPAAAVQLQVAAGQGVHLDPALRVTGELGPKTLSGTSVAARRHSGLEKNWQWRHYALNSGSSSWQRQCNGHTDDSSNQGSSSNQQLVINAGSGRVNLRAISWMDGLKAKLQAQQQQQ